VGVKSIESDLRRGFDAVAGDEPGSDRVVVGGHKELACQKNIGEDERYAPQQAPPADGVARGGRVRVVLLSSDIAVQMIGTPGVQDKCEFFITREDDA